MARNGLTPSRKVGSGYNTGGVTAYPVRNDYDTALFKGDPVRLSAGYIQQSGGTNTVGIGSVRGFFYYGADPAGKPRFTDQLPANTSSYGGQSFEGFTSPVALVVDDPTATFSIPADATVTVGDVGNYFQVSVGSGSTQNGLSGARINVSSRSATSTDRLVKVVGLAKLPGNDWGAASNTVLEVRFANHQNA